MGCSSYPVKVCVFNTFLVLSLQQWYCYQTKCSFVVCSETHLDTCELDSINQYPHERSKTLYVATISNKIRDKFVELLKVSNFSIRVERAIVHCPASCCVFYSVERGS